MAGLSDRFVNARYLARRVTGVERAAAEVLRRFHTSWQPLAPRRPFHAGPFGHLWEQLILPRRIGDGLLWSPANTGPLTAARQVLTIHDLSPLDHPEWYAPGFARWYAWLWPRLVQRVRLVLTDSAFSRDRICARLGAPAGKVQVAPLGVDPVRFSPRPEDEVNLVRREYGLPANYLLAVGSLQPRKNLDRLIAAWNRLQGAFPGWQLILAGTGGPQFRTAVLPAGRAVRLLGYVPETHLPALLSGASGFVQPSLYEGAGLSALEALACGCPAAVADNTALPEYVGGAGLLFDPRDEGTLDGALTRLMGEPDLRAHLREMGLAHVRAFSWERTAELVENALLSVDC